MAFLLLSAAFAYGLAVARYEIWPFALAQDAAQAASSLVTFGEIVPQGRRVRAPVHAAREAFTLHDAESTMPGYYAFLGMDHERRLYSARLYDHRGQLMHTWRIDYESFDPDGPSSGVSSPHAFQVLDDGSILVGFDGGDVMTRLDACGMPIWIKPGIYHHEMTAADDGTVWTWQAEGSHFAQYHYLVNFDPQTGKTLRRIGLIEDVIQKMGPSATIFGIRPDYEFVHLTGDPSNRDEVDLFHPNDVDVLSTSVAAQFPMFEAGDLLMSFRQLNLVAVLDPDTARIKWWRHGPWILQHDPDFTADGYISVYNNNSHRDRSEIIKIHPTTSEIVNELFGGEVEFRSPAMGGHQYLPNGNVLIVVPEEGRVLEASANGDYVMEYNNLSDERLRDYNEHVENGVWLSQAYFSTLPTCAGSS
jgi:hypothetical protein